MKVLREYGLLLLAILALLGVSGVAVYGFNQLISQGNYLYEKGFVQVQQVAKLNLVLKEQFALAQKAPAEMNLAQLKKDQRRFEELATSIGAGLQTLAAGITIEGTPLTDIYATYVKESGQIFKYANLFAQNQAIQHMNEVVTPLFAHFDDFIAQKEADATQLAQASLTDMKATGARLNTGILATSGILVIVVTLLGGYLSILQAQKGKKTKVIVADVQEVLSDVSSSTKEMANLSSDMADASLQAKHNVGSAASIISQTSGNMRAVSAAAEELTATITHIQAQTQESQKMAKKAIEEVQEVSTTVGSMAQSIDHISNFVSTITDISDKTNLLALNAAIEAARAGDAGRGFAVVADEVRKLATQTNTATEQIVTQIHDIETVSGAVVRVITLAKETIDNLNQAVGHVSQAVDEQSQATQDISHSVQDVSHGVEEMNNDLTILNDMTQTVSEHSGNLRMCSDDLAHKTDDLNTKVGTFVKDVVG